MKRLLYEKELKRAEEAARSAGTAIRQRQGKAKITEKAASNLVTEADLHAQETIIRAIQSGFPGHDILAEESDATVQNDSEHLWIIDPLDGTNNFAHSIPHFSVSIAYARNGQVEAGVVYDPVRDEMFTAIRGHGAYLNNAPIKVSDTNSLNQAVIATGFYYDRGVIMRKTLQSMEKLFEHGIHGIRRFGSAALDLCWVACGRFDAFFEYTLSTWDFAAGMLLVSEAGGSCTDQKGGQLVLNSSGLAVSNGRFHDQFLDIVRWDSASETR